MAAQHFKNLKRLLRWLNLMEPTHAQKKAEILNDYSPADHRPADHQGTRFHTGTNQITSRYHDPCPEPALYWDPGMTLSQCVARMHDGSRRHRCTMVEGHRTPHWEDQGLGWGQGLLWDLRNGIEVGPELTPTGKFKRVHRTAVFIEIGSDSGDPFDERVRRQVESYNTTATIKTDVYRIADGKILSWGDPSSFAGTTPGGVDDEEINKMVLKMGYTMFEILREPQLDVSAAAAHAQKVMAGLAKLGIGGDEDS